MKLLSAMIMTAWIFCVIMFNWSAVVDSSSLVLVLLVIGALVLFSTVTFRRRLHHQRLTYAVLSISPVALCVLFFLYAEDECRLVKGILFSESGVYSMVLSGLLMWLLVRAVDGLRSLFESGTKKRVLLILEIAALALFSVGLASETRSGFSSC